MTCQCTVVSPLTTHTAARASFHIAHSTIHDEVAQRCMSVQVVQLYGCTRRTVQRTCDADANSHSLCTRYTICARVSRRDSRRPCGDCSVHPARLCSAVAVQRKPRAHTPMARATASDARPGAPARSIEHELNAQLPACPVAVPSLQPFPNRSP